MMAEDAIFVEPVDYLTSDELKEWQDNYVAIETAEKTNTMEDNWQQARSNYFDRLMLLSRIYTEHREKIDPARPIIINPATGAVLYEAIEIICEVE